MGAPSRLPWHRPRAATEARSDPRNEATGGTAPATIVKQMIASRMQQLSGGLQFTRKRRVHLAGQCSD
jgi:hypothetical protein